MSGPDENIHVNSNNGKVIHILSITLSALLIPAGASTVYRVRRLIYICFS